MSVHEQTQNPASEQHSRNSVHRSLTLHIGAHKTASSLLQTTLRRDGKTLRERGLTRVHRRAILKSEFHESIRDTIQHGGKPNNLERDRESFLSLLEGKSDNVLMTTEDFFETFNHPRFYQHIRDCLEYVCEIVGGNDIKVILYVRNQVDYIESMFMQHVHLGHDRRLEGFISKYMGFDLSWKRVLDDIASVIGRENVVAVPYESIKRVGATSFYQTFLSELGISDVSDLEIAQDESEGRSANRSYSQDAFDIASVINPLLDKDGRNTLRKFLQQKYSTATHPRAVLISDEQRDEIRDRIREDNENLFSEYLSDWEADRAAYL
ncbi:hypothetical protein [Nesterenkonia sp. F]|uniref:hypothetical protein n=1 Tax=Nesterenkonia sp. F TaxID=795955 RepID=UPI001111CE39|nr:hypothetical protein [Nesterenkonia sp. F]